MNLDAAIKEVHEEQRSGIDTAASGLTQTLTELTR
ncbi:cyclin D, partial [Danaus plexippus plexippus]